MGIFQQSGNTLTFIYIFYCQMNNDRPIDLKQKVKYLKEKIDKTYTSLQSRTQYAVRLRFIQIIDDTIEGLYTIDDKDKDFYKQNSPQKDVGKFYSLEKDKIELEKKLMEYKLKELQQKQQKVQVQKLAVQVQSQKVQRQKLQKNYQSKIAQLNQQLRHSMQKLKYQDQQLQRLIKLNKAQHDQIQNLKLQRNRAEQAELQLRQKYQSQMNTLQTFHQKTPKYNYRNTEGLRNVRIFTNISSQKNNHQKFVICELPLKLQVQKIVYGIRMGIILSNKQIIYFNEVHLFQRQMVKVTLEHQHIKIEYLKRKNTVVVDKYKVTKSQVLIMMYGKGDSIMIDQSK